MDRLIGDDTSLSINIDSCIDSCTGRPVRRAAYNPLSFRRVWNIDSSSRQSKAIDKSLARTADERRAARPLSTWLIRRSAQTTDLGQPVFFPNTPGALEGTDAK